MYILYISTITTYYTYTLVTRALHSARPLVFECQPRVAAIVSGRPRCAHRTVRILSVHPFHQTHHPRTAKRAMYMSYMYTTS